jgi:Cu/Ag efflux protein CusF
MKTFASLIAAVAAVAVLAGEGVAQTTKPAAPAAAAPAAPAATQAKTPVVKNITGEFVVMDKTAKTVTVKHMVDQKPAQLIMSVDEAMLASLAQFKAGDKIKVSYEETDGKFVAKTISKA